MTREALANLYEMELLFSHMPPHLAGCVKDKKPGTLEEAASFADTYLYNHGHQQEQQQYRKQSQRLENRDQTKRNFQEQKFQTTGTSQNSKEPAEKGSTSRQRTSGKETRPWMKPKFDAALGPRCFQCNNYGHYASVCPKREHQINSVSEKIKPLLCEGHIEGRVVNEMLVDTGAVRTIVNSRWVPGSARLKKYIRFVPFSGPPRDLPLADVTVDVGGQQVKLEVGVQEDLQYDALLGRDIPFLWNLGDHLISNTLEQSKPELRQSANSQNMKQSS